MSEIFTLIASAEHKLAANVCLKEFNTDWRDICFAVFGIVAVRKSNITPSDLAVGHERKKQMKIENTPSGRLASVPLRGIGILALVAGLGWGSMAQAAPIMFAYTGSIESWTATLDGTYRVSAVGAQGAAGNPRYSGGRGAQIIGDFDFLAGDKFFIAVGGEGVASNPTTNEGSGGGGGGTFFVAFDGTPFLVAGGGGGTRASAGQDGTDASITPYGYNASGFNATYTPVLKTTDLGMGGIVSSVTWGSGGGGFFGNGANDGIAGTGGSSWANGLLGGGIGSSPCASFSGALGGFGGGGAGDGCWGGGGGGGYSGGDGGLVAGGGGSWNTGMNAQAFAGVGLGNGWLSIELLSGSPTPVPEPATLALLGLGLAGLGLMRRRRG